MEQKIATDDTICAISTAPGKGGIAVARVSGTDAIGICGRIWRGRDLGAAATHSAHLGTVTDSDGKPLDTAVATVFRAPGTFTGEDVVELSVHGSRFVQRELVASLIKAGARLAEPGEFTRRAFVNGRMDLAQAEAVADIIASENRASHRIAMNQMRGGFSARLRELRDKLLDICALLELELDFSEEDVEFASRAKLLALAEDVKREVDRLSASFRNASAIKEGIPVAIIGVTNAGKSSLLNALLEDDRAIVSDLDGTTRDVVEDRLEIGDYTFRIMDTAGIRDTADHVEALGIERSRKAAANARIIILVIDSTKPELPPIPATDASIIAVMNKCDLCDRCSGTPAAASAVSDDAPAVSGDVPAVSGDVPAVSDVCSEASDALMDSSSQLFSGIENIIKVIPASAKTAEGIDQLIETLRQTAETADESSDSVMVANARHYQALIAAGESITSAINALNANLSGDLIAIDIRLTAHHLGSILGSITSDDILSTIFSRFCIGK